MYRQLNPLARLTTAVILGSVSITLPMQLAIAQQSATSPPAKGTTQPLDPEFAMVKLQLRILEKQLDQLLGEGVSEGEEFDEIVQRIRDHYHLMHELQRELTAKTSKQAEAAARQSKDADVAKQELLQMREIYEELRAENVKLIQELKNAHQEIEGLKTARNELTTRAETGEKLATRLFKTKYAQAEDAARLLDQVLGNTARISADPRTNSLIVQADAEVLNSTIDILKSLDAPTEKDSTFAEDPEDIDLPPTVMIRFFWLCDGPPTKGAKQAETILPASVCNGLRKIGLENPYLAAQGTTTLALSGAVELSLKGQKENVFFEIGNLPTDLFGDRIQLGVEGEVGIKLPDRLMLSVRTHGNRREGKNYRTLNQFSGSLVTPLDHYVILGATSYAIQPQEQASRSSRRGYGGGYGGYGDGGFGGEFGGGEFGAEEEKSAQPAPQDNNRPAVSQLAYVVQVVPAETFTAEKD